MKFALIFMYNNFLQDLLIFIEFKLLLHIWLKYYLFLCIHFFAPELSNVLLLIYPMFCYQHIQCFPTNLSDFCYQYIQFIATNISNVLLPIYPIFCYQYIQCFATNISNVLPPNYPIFVTINLMKMLLQNYGMPPNCVLLPKKNKI